MPNYLYECQACEYRYEQFTTIADRHLEEKSKCPKCGKKKILLAPAAPAMGDPFKLGVTKLPESWTDKLKEMKNKHIRSTINTERSSRR